jgi:hypothetical protein
MQSTQNNEQSTKVVELLERLIAEQEKTNHLLEMMNFNQNEWFIRYINKG